MIFFGHELMFLLRKARFLLAFFATLLMWVFHERLWLMLKPRYFAELTVPNLVPCKLYSFVIGFLLFVTLKTSHLYGLNCMSKVDSHCCNEWEFYSKTLNLHGNILALQINTHAMNNNRWDQKCKALLHNQFLLWDCMTVHSNFVDENVMRCVALYRKQIEQDWRYICVGKLLVYRF